MCCRDHGNREYVIVRGNNSGVFVGYLINREKTEVTLSHARRLWYWDGAASISQIAISGVSKPQNCKFPAPVEQIIITDVLEILSVTEIAKKSIEGVSEWRV